LSAINSNVSIKELKEVTIEAGRPDSIDLDKLSLIRDFGCSRISINPQSMNDEA
jgi:oxygen-independent coproporphyrinogen-3 oxidase